MIDLPRFQVWFVPGAQPLYGETTLTKVADHSREIVSAINFSSHASQKSLPARDDDTRVDQRVMSRCEPRQELHWNRPLDAYFFSRPDMDSWATA